MSFKPIGSSAKSDSYKRQMKNPNPKYDHVKAQVNTGASLSSYMQKLEEIRKNYRYRKDEIFKRMKTTTFAQLVLQFAYSEEALASPEPSPGKPSGQGGVPPFYVKKDSTGVNPPPLHSPTHPPSTARSTLSHVITGVGQMDLQRSPPGSPEAVQNPPPAPAPPPYLLLDVRDRADYDKCHIVGAHHFPPALLTHSCNYFSREILEYKNRPGRVILIYDGDESIAPQVTTSFIQKDVDNVFMLSGGMKILYRKFPEGMLSGGVPKFCLPSPPPTARKGSGKQSAMPKLPRPQEQSLPVVHRTCFTDEDLDAIQANLDEVLLASDSVSGSRASTQRSTTSVATTTSRSTACSSMQEGGDTDRKPWK